MTEHSGSGAPPPLAKWPFILGDVLLVAVAVVCYAQGRHWPFGTSVGLSPWEGWVLTACIFLGATLSAVPFLLEYRAWIRWGEVDKVRQALQQIRNIEQVGRQVASATASWQAVQDDAGKAVEAARGLQEQLSAEARGFQEFLTKANDAERAHLRLEVEKLRRAEMDWLQVLVRLLDHVWALYQAAVRSGKVTLVEQVSHFQRACRDAALRVGLVPFVAKAGEPLDPNLHLPVRPIPPDMTEPKVVETVATGYRFQGQLVRKVLVAVAPVEKPEPEKPGTATHDGRSESQPKLMPATPLEGPVAIPSDEAPTEIMVASGVGKSPVVVPSGSGDTELTRELAEEFRASADTAFAREVGMADLRDPAQREEEGEPPDERDA